MFLVLLVIASAAAAPSVQHGGRRAEASHYYRQPTRGDVIKRGQNSARTNNAEYPDHRRPFASDQVLPLYEDEVSAVNYQPTLAVSAPQQRSKGVYDNGEQTYRISAPLQNIQQIIQHTPTINNIQSSGGSYIQSERLPIVGSKNTDLALDAQGSSFNVGAAAYEDEGSYGDAYEGQPVIASEERIGVAGLSGFGGPIVVTGGVGVGGGSGGGQGFSHSYGKKQTEGHHHSDHHAKGHKHAQGHKANESYDKGHVEKHGHEHKKDGKKEAIGVKKGHIDEHKAYHKGDLHHKEAKGADKFHSKGHKKGKKVSGSRNVHHKDEYKKDEVFYDEEHDIGHEKVNTHEEGGRHEAKGGESKRGHLNSGYVDAKKGVEGERKEGLAYSSSKGHAGHVGHKVEEGHGEGFQKAGGHKGQEAHGHFYKKSGVA